MNLPAPPTPEQFNELFAKYKAGDEAAGMEIVERNLRFVHQQARRYARYCHSLDENDLLSEGAIGMMRALEMFDPTLGANFLTYASWRVRRDIIRAIRKKEHLIQFPDNLHRQLKEAGDDEISANNCLRAAVNSRNLVSIDAETGENESDLHDTIPAPEDSEQLTEVELRSAGSLTSNAMATLTPLQRYVIEARYGMGDKPPQTLDEVGAFLSLSRERVRQIETIALNGIRARMRGTIENPKLKEAV